MNDRWDEEWDWMYKATKERRKCGSLVQSSIDLCTVVNRLTGCGKLLELISNREEFQSVLLEHEFKILQKQVAFALIDAQQIKIKVDKQIV